MNEDQKAVQRRMLAELEMLKGFVESLSQVEDPTDLLMNIEDSCMAMEEFVIDYEDHHQEKTGDE